MSACRARSSSRRAAPYITHHKSHHITLHSQVDLPRAQLEQTGCTAVAALLTPRDVVCAWVGDSRCVLGTARGATALSHDHKPQHAAESERISAAGGHVFRGRVNGMLAVSRALGDYFYKVT